MNGAWSRPGASQPTRPEQLGTLTQGGTEWGSLARCQVWCLGGAGEGGRCPGGVLGERDFGPGSMRLISADLYPVLGTLDANDANSEVTVVQVSSAQA